MHERLVEAWRRNMAELRAARPWLPERPKIYFAYETSETSGEDRMNVAYLMETATQAGFPTELIAMSQIGVDQVDGSHPVPARSVRGRPADRRDLHALPVGMALARGGRPADLPQHGRPDQARHGLDRAAVDRRAVVQQGPAAGALGAVRRPAGGRAVAAGLLREGQAGDHDLVREEADLVPRGRQRRARPRQRAAGRQPRGEYGRRASSTRSCASCRRSRARRATATRCSACG